MDDIVFAEILQQSAPNLGVDLAIVDPDVVEVTCGLLNHNDAFQFSVVGVSRDDQRASFEGVNARIANIEEVAVTSIGQETRGNTNASKAMILALISALIAMIVAFPYFISSLRRA